MTDLIFDRAAPATITLVFGDDLASLPVDLSLSGTFPALTGVFNLFPPVFVDLVVSFSGLTLVSSVEYLSNTDRPTVSQTQAIWQVSNTIESGNEIPEQHALRTNTGVEAGAEDATRLVTRSDAKFSVALPTHADSPGGFQDATTVTTGVVSTAQEPDHQWLRFFSKFQSSTGVPTGPVAVRFEDGLRDRRISRTTGWKDAVILKSAQHSGAFGFATQIPSGTAGRFQEAQVPPIGRWVKPVVPIVIPPYWGPELLFQCPPLAAPNLVFGVTQCGASGTPEAFFYILPARFYMTAHTIYAQRLTDLADVPIFDATVSADSGSYCWTLSATGPQSLFAQLAPVDGLPVQLRVTLDGIPWLFAVDTLSRTSAFGKSGVSIGARSVTALIGAPYLRATTRTNTESRLAQQLALDALQYSGVDLDWGLTDWLVPAAAWSHQGTPLDAVQAITRAAGGYLQSHRNAATLLTRHPYSQRAGDNPGAPWGWMIGPADVELASDAIITEGLERRDGPDINAVYVSGTTQGVLAQVKRTGSAADKLAAMVTDALITQAPAARQRGLSILGAAGPQYAVRMELPVLTGVGQPGVLDVGQLVQVNAGVPWRGRVRAVSVSAKSPSLRQSITLERHL